MTRIAIVLICLFAANVSRAADVLATQPAQVSLLSWGDWGTGGDNQKLVAEQIAAFAAKQSVPVDAVVLAGDNFKVSLDSTTDPAWKSVFENMYDSKRLPMPFYVALGNHDYEGDKARIEQDYSRENPQSRWKLPARWYRVDFPADHPLVRVLMLDSDKDNLTDAQWEDQLKFIDDELSRPHEGVWTMCVAHHTMISNGTHGDNGVLQRDWGSLFTKHHLDIYLCGHDHSLQHLEVPNWSYSFVVAGGGGADLQPLRRDDRGPFFVAEHGFAHFLFEKDKVTVELVDISGKVIHKFERTKDGVVRTISTSPNGTKTEHPLRVIQGFGDSVVKSLGIQNAGPGYWKWILAGASLAISVCVLVVMKKRRRNRTDINS